VDVRRINFGPEAERGWALDGSTGGSGQARLLSFLGEYKQRDEVGYDLADHYAACAAASQRMLTEVEPLLENEHCDDADLVVIAFGTPAKYVRHAVRGLRAEGHRVGYLRPITLVPFPTEAVAAVAEHAGAIAVYENNQGQMLDDVRLAVLGRAPVRFIGGLSMDHSGFGIAPDLEVPIIRDRIAGLLPAAATPGARA
jgi:2-oxoglutarate ferredoxin oxidoreductase subunit alpha